MAPVLVRVKQGCRLRENGSNYIEGQTFYVDQERVSSIADMVDTVQGVAPVRTAAILSPPRTFEATAMPTPDPKLVEPTDTSTPSLKLTKPRNLEDLFEDEEESKEQDKKTPRKMKKRIL